MVKFKDAVFGVIFEVSCFARVVGTCWLVNLNMVINLAVTVYWEHIIFLNPSSQQCGSFGTCAFLLP